jgi:chromosome segregation ATPase
MSEPLHEHLHAAFFDYREATKDLAKLSPEDQIVLLKSELFDALERAADFQERNRMLERQVEHAQAEIGQRVREVHALSARSARELNQVNGAYQEQLQTLQDAYLVMKRRCAALDEHCQALLLTLERAACSAVAADARAPSPNGACASA